MIDPDNLKSGQIQRKLRSKEFILVNNPKGTHELWLNNISLVGLIDDEGKEQILDGWAVCKHCLTAYRTHSKKDGSGNRKNYGLTSLHTHVKECRANSGEIQASTSAEVPKESTHVQTLISRFAYNKKPVT